MKLNKKLFMMILTAALVGTTFVGCGKNEQPVVEGEVSTEEKNEEVQNEEVQQEQTQQDIAQDPNEEQAEITEGIAEEVEVGMGEKDPTPSDEAYFVATNGLEVSMSMTADDVMLADAYGIDPEILASYRVEMGMNRAAVSEIAVFELKDEAGIEKVKEGIANRQKALEEQWESYLEEQYELVKNAQTVMNGNMILYVISRDSAQIVEQFNGLQ